MAAERGMDRDLLLANSNLASAAMVLAVVALMILPVPPLALDLLITFDIALSVVIPAQAQTSLTLATPAEPGSILPVRLTAREGDRMLAA